MCTCHIVNFVSILSWWYFDGMQSTVNPKITLVGLASRFRPRCADWGIGVPDKLSILRKCVLLLLSIIHQSRTEPMTSHKMDWFTYYTERRMRVRLTRKSESWLTQKSVPTHLNWCMAALPWLRFPSQPDSHLSLSVV